MVKNSRNFKRNIIIVMVFALLISISFSFTYAYLKDRADEVNAFVVGENKIEVKEEYIPPLEMKPGIGFKKKPYITNTGNLPCFVRMRADFSDSEAEEFCEPLDIDTGNWEYDSADGYYYYKKPLLPGEETPPLFTLVKIRDSATLQQMKEFDILIYGESISQGVYEADAYKTAWNEF